MPITVANCAANGYLEWPMVDHQQMHHYAAGLQNSNRYYPGEPATRNASAEPKEKPVWRTIR